MTNPQPMTNIDLNVAEYQSLRAESLLTIQNRFNLFIAGIVGIGAAAGGALSVDIGTAGFSIYTLILLSWIIPIFASAISIAWLSEAIRSHRVGFYIAKYIENGPLNQSIQHPINWETSLWEGEMNRDEKFGPSSAIIMLFIGFSIISIYVSCFMLGISFNSRLSFSGNAIFNYVVFCLAPQIVVALFISYFRIHIPVLQNIHPVKEKEYPKITYEAKPLMMWFLLFLVLIYVIGTILVSALTFISAR